ncbi:MAG TPA: AsmA family protein, partial [Planctomycetota bacterium]|nr:AsmA family protein [Planctomycetota bacterium]
ALKLANDGMVRIKSKRVVVGLNGVAVMMDFFPFPVQKLTGQIEWNGDAVTVNARGSAGKTQVEAAGEISLAKEPIRETYNLTVNVREIDVDDRVLKSLPEEIYGVLRDLNPEGTVDVTARLKLEPGDTLKVTPVAVVADLRNARATVKQFPYPVQNISGRVEWNDGIVKVAGVRAAWGETVVDVSGEINTNDPTGESTNSTIVVNARGIDLDDRLRRALDEPMKATYDALSPWGKVNAICVLCPNAGSVDDVIQKLVIELDRCEATYSGFPYRLKGLTGKVTVKDEVAYLENITGYSGGSTVRLSGHIWTGNPADPMELRAECDELAIQARRVQFDSYLKDAMSDDWRTVWDRLQPEGTFDANLLLSWLPGGTVWVDDGSSITTRDSFLSGYRIPDAVYPIRIDDDFITFKQFRGVLYGGQVRGEMRFARKSDRFVSQLVLSNVDLKQFHDEHGFEWDIRGELCGTVNLSGLTNDKNSLDGNAELQIRNGQLASINVVASMVIQLVNLQWTGGSAITDMDVVCKLKDGKVHFGDDQKDERGEILLSGPGVPIAGAGTITLGGDMDLVFVTSKESKQGLSAVLRSIPLLGKVWGLIDDNIFAAIRDQLIKVKVTGNVMDPEPKVSAQPLVVIIGPVKSFWKAVFGSSAPEETKPDASTTPKQ